MNNDLTSQLRQTGPLVSPEGICFRDLDHDGVMAPYENPTLPADIRVHDLLQRMTLEEKAGLMFHTIIDAGRDGKLVDQGSAVSGLGNTELVQGKLLNHFNVLRAPDAANAARWHNKIQELAAGTRLGIPVTFSSDPRHSFTQNIGAGIEAGYFSRWPEAIGLAAIGDEQLVSEFAEIARQEYLAIGIRTALHPSIDLATEPRWARQYNTFGQDADLTARLVRPYIKGFQGDQLGHDSVSCIAKHFPGGGPQKDGEDPHFPYGREQIYPGGYFDYHLKPFKNAIEVGVAGMMPYYGMPQKLELDGEPVEEVGFGFNKQILTDLLRDRLGFDGVICTDWAILQDKHTNEANAPARAWGAEHLTPAERTTKCLDAGADQFGGEYCPEIIVELVGSGRISEQRINESAKRLLRAKFLLGLFDDPYISESHAVATVGKPDFIQAGAAAQRRAYTVLTNGTPALPTLPVKEGLSVYAPDINQELLSQYCKPVDDPAHASLALLRLSAPFEARSDYFLEDRYRAGSLEYQPEQLEPILQLLSRVPTIVDIYMDRPAVVPEIAQKAAALVANFGADDSAFLDVVFGRAVPEGRLPFEIPRSMAAIVESREDVPSDTKDPLFRFGHGLRVMHS